MSNLSVKDVPEPWAEALRQRAARNHRSLQGELMAIIEAAVRDGAPPAVNDRDANRFGNVLTNPYSGRAADFGFDRFDHPVTRQGWKSVEQVAVELNAKYPEPVLGQPLGADIIREERDAR